MQFSKVVALAPFAWVIYCENIDSLVAELPACSRPCLKTAYESAGCEQTDYACGCDKIILGNTIFRVAADCIDSACNDAESLEYWALAVTICDLARIPGFSSSDTALSAPSTTGTVSITSVSETAPRATPTLATSTTTVAESPTDHPTSSTASPSSAPTPSPLPASSDNPKASLSTGAAVGIGVGVTLGSLAVLAAIVFFTLRYRRKSKELKNLRELSAQVGIERGDDELGKPEIDGKEAKGRALSGGVACMVNEGHVGGERGYTAEFPAVDWGRQGAVELQGAEKGSNSA